MNDVVPLLNDRERLGLVKFGDAYLPGGPEFPKFSKLNCISKADHVLAYLPEQDLKDLKLLLGVAGFLPGFVIAVLVASLEYLWMKDLPMGSVLRQIRLGLRGLVFSLYYSSSEIEHLIGYQVKVIVDQT